MTGLNFLFTKSGGFAGNDSHRPGYLNPWALDDGAGWEASRGVALLEQVCVIGGRL